MSSLSDFAKNFKPKEKAPETQNIHMEELKKNFDENQNASIDENIKKTMEKFENMDQGQLYNELFQEASRLKGSGQFDYNMLYNSIQNMSAYISPEQKESMLNLLDKLR